MSTRISEPGKGFHPRCSFAAVAKDAAEFVRSVMEALDCDGPTELARALGLTSYAAPKRITRWLAGETTPDYASTMLMFEKVGWLAIPDDASRGPAREEAEGHQDRDPDRGSLAEAVAALGEATSQGLAEIRDRLESIERRLPDEPPEQLPKHGQG
jgi:hypothetical protein